MTEVMPEAPSAVSDRSHLYAFLTATDASATALERPVCRGWVGDYQISGKTGHVLANGAGYLLYVHIDERTAMEREPSSRPWKNAKARLTFCKVTQDGDWEWLGLVLPVHRARRLLALHPGLEAVHDHGGYRCIGYVTGGAAGVRSGPGQGPASAAAIER